MFTSKIFLNMSIFLVISPHNNMWRANYDVCFADVVQLPHKKAQHESFKAGTYLRGKSNSRPARLEPSNRIQWFVCKIFFLLQIVYFPVVSKCEACVISISAASLK